MQTDNIRVVHYLNQFFGGLGGEEKADIKPQIKEGPVGPGRAIQNILGKRGEVIATVICGDNYFAEHLDKATDEILSLIQPVKPDVIIAGPAFEAGRYGVACGQISQAVQKRLNLPAVTGMYEQNPGIDLYHKDVYIIQTGNNVRTMTDSVNKMVNLAIKLVKEQPIGKPTEEGYIPRGMLINEQSERTGAERVVAMLLNKLQGKPYESEVSQPRYERVEPAPPIKNLSNATIALVTDGGLVPKGNPDKIESGGATKFGKYFIGTSERLNAADFDVNHAGYDHVFIEQDPNRLVPLDVMRELENENIIGKLHDYYYATTGVATTVENAKKFGRAIAADLKASGVSGVILTST
jgi:glycine reductase complex component B subunit gamma